MSTSRRCLLATLCLLLNLQVRAAEPAINFPNVQKLELSHPGQGEARSLFDADHAGGVAWKAGDGEPTQVSVSFSVPPQHAPRQLRLVSRAVNWWWSVPRIQVEARRSDRDPWQTVLDQEWYIRGRDDEQDEKGSKRFELPVPLDRQDYRQFRLTLKRSHPHINMMLSEIEVQLNSGVMLKVVPNWLAYEPGQPCKATAYLTSAVGDETRRARLQVDVVNVSTGQTQRTCLSRQIDLRSGMMEIPFTFNWERTGEYRLEPRLQIAGDATPVFAHASQDIVVVPQSSKYMFPMGTDLYGSDQPTYGFNARHHWTQYPEPLSDTNMSDPFASLLREGLVDSLVAPLQYVDFEKHGFGGDARRAVRADGSLVEHGFLPTSTNLPVYEVKQEYIDRLTYWDGHPGFHQVAFNNEKSFVEWVAGGLIDYHPEAIRKYWQWLEQQHGRVSDLNALYGTKYASFSEVEPPRDYPGPGPQWFDWMMFRQASLADFMRVGYQSIKPHAPHTLISPKPVQVGDYLAASTAIDPWQWYDACDVYMFDLYTFVRGGYMEAAFGLDFHRTQLRDKGIEFGETNLGYFRPTVVERTAMEINRAYWPAFLRGLKGCYWFDWYASWDQAQRGYWLRDAQGELFETGEEVVRMSKQVQTLAPILNTGKPTGQKIAIYYAWEQIHQLPNIAPMNAIRGAYKLMSQLHYPVDVITYHNVRAGDLSKYQVLVLPGTTHLFPEVAREIERFVSDGGLLIADAGAGRFDHYHRPLDTLTPVLGVTRIRSDDRLSQIALSRSRTIRLPEVRTNPRLYNRSLDAHEVARGEVVEAGPSATVLATFPSKTIEQRVLDDAEAQHPTFKMPEAPSSDAEGPPAGLPAIVTRAYGQGHTLYFAAAAFNIHRNHFYTLNKTPTPASRANELIYTGDPVLRDVVRDFLAGHGITPPVQLDLASDDPEADNAPYQIVSMFGSDHGLLVGVTNWGPHRPYQVPVTVDLPFDHVSRVYILQTHAEKLIEPPYTVQGGRLTTTIPDLHGSVVLMILKDGGPLLARARLLPDREVVRVAVVNHLPERAVGSIEVRVDGRHEPLSSPVAIDLPSSGSTTVEIPVSLATRDDLRRPRGDDRPWYVWITYDGNARSFARVEGVELPSAGEGSLQP